ncbi:MAG: pectinesterase family protein [Phycisphaerales bacterium]
MNRNKIIFASLIFIAAFLTSAKAVNMTITNTFPAANATEICYDTKLWITFDSAPIVSIDPNKHLQICKLSDDSVVYDLQLKALPTNTYGPISTNWPYKITLAGRSINYEPFVVNGNVIEIYPSVRLEYNTSYYVKMTEAFCKDSQDHNSPEINDNTTWRFTTKASAPAADHEYVVALDSSGDFCTMQGVIDAVADNDTLRTLIKIKDGNYRGVFYILNTKNNITLLGENKDTTILSAYNREAFNGGSDYRMLVRSYGANLRIYNLTMHNTTPDGGNQAETIKQSGNKCIIENCKFRSFQDTLCLNGQIYMNNSYVEGDSDFIWNTGTVYFNKCEIKCLTDGSVVSQPRTSSVNGFFFVDCAITSEPNVNDCYLGRLFLGYNYAQSAFINCTMPADLFKPIGWNKNDQTNMDSIRLWEYKSRTPEGTLIDVSQRLTPGSRQLTDAETLYWRDANNVFQYSAWNPKIATQPPSPAWQPHPENGQTEISSATLTWSQGADVVSHMVYFGTANPPPFVAEVTESSYTINQFVTPATTYYWRVDEKNSAGTTTGTVWNFVTSPTLDAAQPSPNPMQWSVEPHALSISSITMTAVTAIDASPVEYKFTNVTDGNHNSQWQDSPVYTDTGLDNNKMYYYKVMARDKSMNHNATDYSLQAGDTTDQYECTSAITSDLSGDCQTNFEDFAFFADAWLLPRNYIEKITNGSFDSELSPWSLVDAASPYGIMTAEFDALNGLPAGSAFLTADTNEASALANGVNNHRFYQLFPVTVGKNYKFVGQWKGLLSNPDVTSKRNWAEVFLGFSSDTTPSTWGENIYKKRYAGVGDSRNMNFSPTSDGSFDWEDLSLSPNTSPVPPATAVWTATQPYMVVSFNIGGIANGGAMWINLDNIAVTECPSADADLNIDCEVNLKDVAVAANDWLTCRRNPSDECWQ